MRISLAIVALAVLLGGPAPVVAQHGQDVPPPGQMTNPNQRNPTADSVSEQELLRQMHKLQGRITIPDPKAATLEQQQGRSYQFFHERLLPWIAGVVIILMLLALAAFYWMRGPVRLDEPQSGIKVKRFDWLERLTHWMTATSFIILALTGLNYFFGKRLLLPLIGPHAFGTWSQWAKFAHDTFAWPFILGLLLMLALWLRDNLPDRYDWIWLKQFGGFTSGTHPPARRFNAGQKLIFWAVVAFGSALAVTGILMLLPFWALDINAMQWAQYVHALSATLLIAVIIAHIYIGTLGMEGAFEAMRTGEVDLTWAREHHPIWVEEDHPDLRPAARRITSLPAE